MFIELIKGLFVNMAILTSIIMFANIIMHEKYLCQTLKNNIRNGILSGIFGCILMLFSVPITDQIILDFRYIPVIMMAIYVSDYASLETALIIGIFRIAFWGVNEPSLWAFINVIVVSIVCGIISRINIQTRTKWLLSVASTSLITGVIIYSFIAGLERWYDILLVYSAGSIFVSIIMFYFTEYIAEFNRKIELFKDEAEKDYLTGLKNSRQFDKHLKKRLKLDDSSQTDMAVLYIDIDHFKNINDKYGHSSGDLVLKEIGLILKEMARSQDIISRMGGEEFTMLLVDCKLAQAEIVAERIRSAVENYEFRMSNNQIVHITISIGVATIPRIISDGSKVLEQADKALYQAKRAGRNKVVIVGGDHRLNESIND